LPRYLHSFPTRRSSDLLLAFEAKFYSVIPPDWTHAIYADRRRLRISDADYLPHAAAELSPDPIPENHFFRALTSLYVPDYSAVEDRKSTRLNSSHVSIS